MAVKYVIFAALLVACVKSAPVKNDICLCENDEAYQEKIWQLLKEIDPKLDDYPVAPGMLSPQVPCSNCIEYNRRKRKTEKQDSEEDQVTELNNKVETSVKEKAHSSNHGSEEDDEIPEDVDYGYIPGVSDKTCPEGTIRQGPYCVDIPAVLLG